MGGEAVGAGMPLQVSLDDLAAMAAADENHRYELSLEGVLSVAALAEPGHALLVSRLFAWLLANGYTPDQVAIDCGINIGGARVPDLTVWAKGSPPRSSRSSYADTAGLLLVIEVLSRESEVIDRIIKKAEYARARIPCYWIVERDNGATVRQYALDVDTGAYQLSPGGPSVNAASIVTTVVRLKLDHLGLVDL
ncbi:Uma2 family endonuclease [Micromonospora sp. DT4]|uniref:Uma2 family endonuclease n=1 Tax=Micromonospora sp. DT4 TaxID=3393438 RepID=UPI003CEA3655